MVNNFSEINPRDMCWSRFDIYFDNELQPHSIYIRHKIDGTSNDDIFNLIQNSVGNNYIITNISTYDGCHNPVVYMDNCTWLVNFPNGESAYSVYVSLADMR